MTNQERTDRTVKERRYIEARKAAFTVAEYEHKDDPELIARRQNIFECRKKMEELRTSLAGIPKQIAAQEAAILEYLEQFLPPSLQSKGVVK